MEGRYRKEERRKMSRRDEKLGWWRGGGKRLKKKNREEVEHEGRDEHKERVERKEKRKKWQKVGVWKRKKTRKEMVFGEENQNLVLSHPPAKKNKKKLHILDPPPNSTYVSVANLSEHWLWNDISDVSCSTSWWQSLPFFLLSILFFLFVFISFLLLRESFFFSLKWQGFLHWRCSLGKTWYFP